MTKSSTSSDQRGERGVVLLYALVFTTAIALVVAALLAQSEVQYRAVDAYRDRRNGVFAADAGLERALSTIGMFAAPPGTGDGATCTDSTRCPTTPALSSQKEASGGSPLTVPGLALGSGRGTNRVVIVATGTAGTEQVTGVTLAGTSMHRANGRTAQGCWFLGIPLCAFTTEVWYLLDAELPAAAGNQPVQVTVAGGGSVAAHVSSWVGVLQDLDDVPYVPTSAGTSLESGTSQISASVTTVAASTLVVSAAGHHDDALLCLGNDNLSGSGAGTRLTNGPHPPCGGLGTSYAVRSAGTQSVTESFAASSTATAQVLVGFRSASSAPPPPPVFGATCTGGPMTLPDVNGYQVSVVCQMTSSSTLAVTSTARRGDRVATGQAIITRHADGMVEVTQWETRPGAV